jgi:hypothetical protein
MSRRPIALSLHARRLVDDTVLAYVEWREECAAVWECYERWAITPGWEAARAQAAYRAALDREEAAAVVYAHRLERLGELLPSSPWIAGVTR